MLDDLGFDLWADGYDASVGLSDKEDTYPFAGYKSVLSGIYEAIRTKKRPTVLDLGFGTATLTASGDAMKRSYMYAGKCVYTATVTDAAGTTYQNKTSVDLTAPVVAAKSISLKDEIGVNFSINVPLGTDVSGAEVA